jgi:Ca-activated chloride channel family protein
VTRRGQTVTALAACFCVVTVGFVATAQQTPSFSARVELVRVDVLVTSNNRAVTGLKASDFELRDNGVPQPINVLTDGLQSIPLSVVFVFDTSESMAGSRLSRLAEAGRGVLDRLRPADQAALLTFSEATVVQRPLSHDLDAVRRGLSEMRASGRTSLFDALYAAFCLPRPLDTRSMVLLFSDGADTSSWLDAAELQYTARQSDVVLYAVGLDSTIRDELKAVSEETGGAVVVAESPNHLQSLFVRLLAEMQSRYLLTYYVKGVNREGWHVLDVRLRTGKGQVTARRGYYVAPRECP